MQHELKENFKCSVAETTNLKNKYTAHLKRDVFLKFFAPAMKVSGFSKLRITHKDKVELQYYNQRIPNITMTLETGARNI